jgi:hypothetical protein
MTGLLSHHPATVDSSWQMPSNSEEYRLDHRSQVRNLALEFGNLAEAIVAHSVTSEFPC